MNTSDDDLRPSGSQPQVPPPPLRRWWNPFDRDLVLERSRAQVDRIVERFQAAGQQVGVQRDPDGQPAYLYRPGVILTRDRDAERVYRALGMSPPVEKNDPSTPALQPGGLHVVPLPSGREDVEVLDDLDARFGVGVATPDHLLHVNPVTWCMATEPQLTSTDSWTGTATDAEADGRSQLVVVVDTGSLQVVIDDREWLRGGSVTGTEELSTVGHYSGHGTFIAGVVRQYAPACAVHVEAVLSIGGAAYESDVVMGLAQALNRAPDVINLSAGTRTRRDRPLLSFEVFHETHLSQLQDTVLVTAAGNDGDRGPFWPAAFPWTLAVGALDEDGESRVGFSNYGSWVDVFALGTSVVNAFPNIAYDYLEPPQTPGSVNFDNGLAAWSGTSFAAPMVAGLIAARMTWSGEGAAGSAASLLQIARRDAAVGTGARLRSASAASRGA